MLQLPETIKYRVEEHMAVVTIDRPERRNAMTPEMRTGIREAFAEANADSEVWVIVFEATGEKAFSAGADLGTTIKNLTDDPPKALSEIVVDPAKRHFHDIYKPIIAAVQGVCTGGGLEMLQGTDIRIASEDARFGLGEVKWGIVPLGGSHVRLPRQIPWAVAMEMLLTGDPITAERAFQIGLVNEVVPFERLHARAYEVAARLCQNGPLAMQIAKESVVRAMHLEEAFASDYYVAQRAFFTEDAKEGPTAFLEKRPAQFKAR